MNRKGECASALVTLLLLFTVSLTVPIAQAYTTRLYVDPANITNKTLDENFTVVIKIGNVTDLYTWVIGLQWDPNVLYCHKVQYMYGFFPGADALAAGKDVGYKEMPGSIDNTGGYVIPYGMGRVAAPGVPSLRKGINGSGPLFNATFQVKDYGETWINITGPWAGAPPQLINSNVDPIPADIEAGWFELKAEPPVASFTTSPPPHFVNELITFDASSSQPGFSETHSVPIANYTWNFGDGNSSFTVTTPTVTHVYRSTGTFTVTLTVKCEDDPVLIARGLTTDSTQRSISIIPPPEPPVASFTKSPPPYYVNTPISFNATGSGPGFNGTHNVPIANYTWNFGDGTTATVKDLTIQHAYVSGGEYTVILTVTCVDDSALIARGLTSGNTRQNVTVYLPHGPTAQFKYSPYPYPLVNGTVTFNATGSGPGFNGTHNVPIANYTWNFGDKNVTTVADPVIQHVYVLNGTYTVNLTVTCQDDPVLIPRGLTSSSTWQNLTVTNITGSITVKVQWSNGTPIQGAEVRIDLFNTTTNEEGFAYSRPLENGTYSLEVSYMNITLLNTTFFVNTPVTVTCTVYLPPVAYFTYSPPSPRVKELVTFDASASHDPDGGAIASYTWDFGDGATGSGVDVTHAYAVDGVYRVTLRVTDDEGDSAIFSFNVTVSPLKPPVAYFTYSPAAPYVGKLVTFDASASYDPDGIVANYTWNFGDDTSSVTETTAVTTHTYTDVGTYLVTLIVTDDDGLNDTFSVNLTVSALPTYSLTVETKWSNRTVIEGAQAEVSNETGLVSNGTTDASGRVEFLLTGEKAYNVTVSYLDVTLLNTTVHLMANTTLRCTVNSEPYETARSLQELIKELLEDVAYRDAQIGELQGNVTALLNTLAELQGNVTALNNTISDLQGNLTNIQREYSSLQGEVNTRFYMGIGGGLIIGLVVGVATVLVLWKKILKSPPK